MMKGSATPVIKRANSNTAIDAEGCATSASEAKYTGPTQTAPSRPSAIARLGPRVSVTASDMPRPSRMDVRYWLPITTPTTTVPMPSVSCTWCGTTGNAIPIAKKPTKTASVMGSSGRKAEKSEGDMA